MHMADALVTPAVGGAMWAATAGAVAYSARKVERDMDERKVPLMGVMGAFIFVAQMINFSIPGTGSSGHLAGALMLSILLGPYAAFIVMASIVTVQALLFADGGLLALGCNVFNMAFFTCFIAYPLIYKPITRQNPTPGRVFLGSMIAAIIGLQLGAFSVVLETVASGISALPFKTFSLLMQPIHLAIGAVEGLVTAAVVTFVLRVRPELLERSTAGTSLRGLDLKGILTGFAVAALIAGGAISWFASANPDGLEWAVQHAAGKAQSGIADGVHRAFAEIQKKTALLPDYGLGESQSSSSSPKRNPGKASLAAKGGTSLAGLTGGVFIVVFAVLAGAILRGFKRRRVQSSN